MIPGHLFKARAFVQEEARNTLFFWVVITDINRIKFGIIDSFKTGIVKKDVLTNGNIDESGELLPFIT